MIPPETGYGFYLKKGQRLKVIDVEGSQVADFVAYTTEGSGERLDPGATMDLLSSKTVLPGQKFYSNRYRAMLTLTADTVGQHDLFLPACRQEMYEALYGTQSKHANCYENLNHALEGYGVEIPGQHRPFNIFMNTVLSEEGSLKVAAPLSKAGDYVELQAEMDLIIAVSVCPCVESACNGFTITPLQVEILS